MARRRPDYLGMVSAKYESGGRGVGFISSGRGDPGGRSYGIHQLSGAYSMAAFLRSKEGAPYQAEFGSTRPQTSEFNSIYRSIAKRDPEGFATAQHNYYTRTHYEPVRQVAQRVGFDVSNRGVQEALFSTSIQHARASRIVERAGRGLTPNMGADAQIRSLYDARTEYVAGLGTLNDRTKQSVLSRYQRERQDALAMAIENTPLPASGPVSVAAGDTAVGGAVGKAGISSLSGLTPGTDAPVAGMDALDVVAQAAPEAVGPLGPVNRETASQVAAVPEGMVDPMNAPPPVIHGPIDPILPIPDTAPVAIAGEMGKGGGGFFAGGGGGGGGFGSALKAAGAALSRQPMVQIAGAFDDPGKRLAMFDPTQEDIAGDRQFRLPPPIPRTPPNMQVFDFTGRKKRRGRAA